MICDRFSDSTRAYQGAAGGLADAIIATLERIVVGATAPDLTVLLDIDAKAGLARAESRRKGGIVGASPGAFVAVDTFEARTLAFHERLRDGFLGIAKHEPARVVVLDAFQNAQTLSDQVLALVTTRLGSPS